MANSNTYMVVVGFMHYVNDCIDLYTKLADNWKNVGDTVAANERMEKAIAYGIIRDDIDAIVHKHYPYVRIIDMLESESFVWSIDEVIAKRIDYVFSYGYAYVMRSRRLRAHYHALTCAYEQLQTYCNIYKVFNGNMH